MQRKAFEQLVKEAMDRIPPEFQEAMKNIAVVIKDRPGEEAAEDIADSDEGLYGLYSGIPLPERNADDSGTMPDVIYLYRQTLEADFPDRADLIREIEITLVHEIAHYFGFGEDTLERYGYD
jgi:predicted Zn-dependent protease with MMP-like domain